MLCGEMERGPWGQEITQQLVAPIPPTPQGSPGFLFFHLDHFISNWISECSSETSRNSKFPRPYTYEFRIHLTRKE